MRSLLPTLLFQASPLKCLSLAVAVAAGLRLVPTVAVAAVAVAVFSIIQHILFPSVPWRLQSVRADLEVLVVLAKLVRMGATRLSVL